MDSESSFVKRLSPHIYKMFPGYRIASLESISKNPDAGRLEAETYELVIENLGKTKKIIVKRFGNKLADRMKKDFYATVKLSAKKEINVPAMYGFFSDINSFLIERVEGISLLNLIVRSYANPAKTGTNAKIALPVQMVAKSIAFIQNLTVCKPVRFSCKSFFDDKEYDGLAKILGNTRKLSDIAESIEGRKICMSRGYNDLKTSHVIVTNGGIKIIDFAPFATKFCFINPVAFSVSMELAQKMPFFRRRDFLFLRERFYGEYKRRLGGDADMDFLEKMELLKKCQLLYYFRNALKRKGIPLSHRISAIMDVKYLSEQIKKYPDS